MHALSTRAFQSFYLDWLYMLVRIGEVGSTPAPFFWDVCKGYGARELASDKGIGCYLSVSGHVITRILGKMANNILWLW